jgi:hypothetical protein
VKFLRLPVFFIDYFKNRNIDLGAKIDLLEIMPFFFESEGGFIAELQKR